MRTEARYHSVRLTYEQAYKRASRQFGKGGAAAYNLPGCIYCGADALATSLNLQSGDVAPPPEQPYGPGHIRVELTTHLCRRHANALKGDSARRHDLANGTSGMVIAGIVYLIVNLFGASNNVPFFSSRNIVLVVLAGLAVLALGALLGEWLGRRFSRQPLRLPPAVRLHNEDSHTLVFEFLRQACADDLQAQIKADEAKP